MSSLFHYGIACALEDVPLSWPIILRGSIEQITSQAKEIGYEAIELQMCNPQNYDWNTLRVTLDQMGMKLCAVATGRELLENKLSLISEDVGIRRAAIDRLKCYIDMCAVAGGMVIEGSMRSTIPDLSRYEYYENFLIEATLELSDYAAIKNVPIVIENITAHISNYLNTIKQVTDFIRKVKRSNIGLHLDTYSMLMEDNNIYGSVSYCAPELQYVHFSDSARRYPGCGNVDFKSFMKALKMAGYNGYISTECIPYPDAYTCAKYGFEYMKALETCVRIETANER